MQKGYEPAPMWDAGVTGNAKRKRRKPLVQARASIVFKKKSRVQSIVSCLMLYYPYNQKESVMSVI